MAIRQAAVPFQEGYDFGIGADLVSGSPMGLVVDGHNPTGVGGSHGSVTTFQVQRIQTTSDLERALNINVDASYGFAAFGAGVDARFNFVKQCKVQTTSLFMLVTAEIVLEFKQIDDPVLTQNAAALVDRPADFANRFGNVFVRGIRSGGLFVGVLRMDTSSDSEAENIAASLQGSYDLFSLDADVKFSDVEKRFRAAIFCAMHSEGGPSNLGIDDPSDPRKLLANVKAFLTAFNDNPSASAVPYHVTLAPIAIAQGPLPPNDADIEHADDVLRFCATRRSQLLDQLNLLQVYVDSPSRFDFSNGANAQLIRDAAVNTQSDLDLIARCASAAINHPASAAMPADFAALQTPPTTFPKAVMPDPLPTPKPNVVTVPDFVNFDPTPQEDRGLLIEVRHLADSLGLPLVVIQRDPNATLETPKVVQQDPAAGTPVAIGSPVKVVVDED